MLDPRGTSWPFGPTARRGTGLVLLVTLVLGMSIVPAGGQSQKPSAFSAARSAVARGQVEKLRMLGFGIINTPFTDMPREGGLLIGFDVSLTPHGSGEIIAGVRPVFLTAAG